MYSKIGLFWSKVKLISPRRSSGSPGAMSGFIWDIESSITIIWAYKGHMNKKWYGSSIPNPHLHDGSSSAWRLKCRCAFSLLQPIHILVWWIFTNLSPTLNHGILICDGKWSVSLRSNRSRLRELRISIIGSMFHSFIVEGKNDLM